jgi:hypothetical protein
MTDPRQIDIAEDGSDSASDVSRLIAQKSQLLRLAAQDRSLGAVTVRVFLAAVDQVHRKTGRDFGLRWPSVATLAQAAGTNARSVHRALTQLSAQNYLIPIRRGGGRSAAGHGQPNVFRLGTLPKLAALPEVATLPDSPPNPATLGTRTLPEVADNPIEDTQQKTQRKNAAVGYAFDGQIIKLSQADFEKLQESYSFIPDLRAALTSYDVWLDGNLVGSQRKKWWQRMHNKLDALNQEQAAKRQQGSRSNINESW